VEKGDNTINQSVMYYILSGWRKRSCLGRVGPADARRMRMKDIGEIPLMRAWRHSERRKSGEKPVKVSTRTTEVIRDNSRGLATKRIIGQFTKSDRHGSVR